MQLIEVARMSSGERLKFAKFIRFKIFPKKTTPLSLGTSPTSNRRDYATMAFVTTTSFSRVRPKDKLTMCARRSPKRAPRWTSMARSHPYGNGGLPDEPDYTGWDREALMKEIAEAEANFVPADPDGMKKWVLVMAADIIQWNNNLFKASKEQGFEWDLSGINVVAIHENIARKCIEPDTTDLWILLMGEDGVLSFGIHDKDQSVDEGDEVLLTFTMKDEALRFADQLIAEGMDPKLRLVPIPALKEFCRKDGMILGLVPAKTLVTPGQFDRAF